MNGFLRGRVQGQLRTQLLAVRVETISTESRTGIKVFA